MFKTMLKISGTICLGHPHAKLGVSAVNMQGFSYDLLLREFERRYDSIAVALRIAVQHGWDTYITQLLQRGKIDEAEGICQHILKGNHQFLVQETIASGNQIRPSYIEGPRILPGCIALS